MWIYSFILQSKICAKLVQIKGILAAKYLVIFLKMSYLITSVNKTYSFLRLKNEKCHYLLQSPVSNISTWIFMYELYIDSTHFRGGHSKVPQNLACKVTVLHAQLYFMQETSVLPYASSFYRCKSPLLHRPVRSIFTWWRRKQLFSSDLLFSSRN